MTQEIDQKIYNRRHVLNKAQQAINVIDLISAAVDGYFPRHRLCDALTGQILFASYLGLVTKRLADVFETTFTRGPNIRIKCWKNAGGPFLGPCSRPMKLPASQNTCKTLCGKPARGGISKWTFESIAAALRAGDLNVWYWLLQTLFAGNAPGELAYEFGSHDISRLPFHYKDDNIGYESEDDSRGWGPGKNPLAKRTSPPGVIRPSKDKIYFNLPYYNKLEDPRKAIKLRIKYDIKQSEDFMLKYLGRHGNITEIVSTILEHGNRITPDTVPPSVVTTSTTNSVSGNATSSASASPAPSSHSSSCPVRAILHKRKVKSGKPTEPTKRRKNLHGVVADVDSTDFEEDDEDDEDM